MAAASRDIIVNKGATRIAGITSTSIAIGKEAIDITTDEDNGYRTLLDVAGTKTLDISFSGVLKDSVILNIAGAEVSQLLTDIDLELAPIAGETTGATFSGDFWLNGYTVNGGGSDGAIEFDGTLQSSGAWTFTPGA